MTYLAIYLFIILIIYLLDKYTIDNYISPYSIFKSPVLIIFVLIPVLQLIVLASILQLIINDGKL